MKGDKQHNAIARYLQIFAELNPGNVEYVAVSETVLGVWIYGRWIPFPSRIMTEVQVRDHIEYYAKKIKKSKPLKLPYDDEE